MNLDIDYYELLEVERTADEKTLKTAYRRIAMECHPDRNPGCDKSEAKFKAVSQAYDVLKDPQKRAAYDRYGKEAFENGGMGAGGGQGGGGFGDFSDIFESFFGDAFGGRQRGPARGADLRYDLEISLDEAFHGKEAEITIDVATACGTCEGTGATPGSGKRRCNLCAGHGKVRAQQGFFVVERTCPTCHGRGEVIESPCRACGGKVERMNARPSPSMFRRASTKARAFALLVGVRQDQMVQRQVTCTSSSIYCATRCSNAMARHYSAACPSASPQRRWGVKFAFRGSMVLNISSSFQRAYNRVSSFASAGQGCPSCKGGVVATWSFKSTLKRRQSCPHGRRKFCASSAKPKLEQNVRNPLAFLIS
jgi:hypothetical protein